jgi:UDP-N-acetylglucosamine 4-epimerase
MSITNCNILVTGGAGFIGSHIVEHFIKKNVKFIRILDNLSTGNKNNIQKFLDQYSNIEFMYGDISDINICKKAMKNIDIVSHQAAIGSVSKSIEDPLSSHIANVNGFLNILISAKENNIKRIVYASSSSVYGDNQDLPKCEDKIGNVLSPYASTKLIDEIYANLFSRCYGMECIGLRYFNVFGSRQNPNGAYAAVIPKFINSIKNNVSPQINGDGNFSRDFTYVDNIVFANILALSTTNKECYGQVFNIGTGGQISINDLFNIIKRELKSNVEPIYGEERKGDIPHSNADISKAIFMLEYNPIVSFDEGIIKTINFYCDVNNNTNICI